MVGDRAFWDSTKSWLYVMQNSGTMTVNVPAESVIDFSSVTHDDEHPGRSEMIVALYDLEAAVMRALQYDMGSESQADVVLEDLAEVYGSLRKATIRARARGDLA